MARKRRLISQINQARHTMMKAMDKGENLLVQGMSLLKEVNAKMNQGFDEAELDTVSRYLQHVTRIFSTKSD